MFRSARRTEREAGRDAINTLPRTMQALVKTAAAPGMEMRELPVPQIGPTDVLIAVETASVCSTDLHIYHWDEWAQNRIKPPYTPGHEFCGTIAAVGELVRGLAIGGFVSAEMHIACGALPAVPHWTGARLPVRENPRCDDDGAFADYVRIPAANVWKLSPEIPREFGSLFDPFGNAVHTALSGPIAAQTVAVTGCGPIGLFSIAIAKACGASRVFAIEPNAKRRELARRMGADLLLDPSAEDVEAKVKAETDGNGVDVLLEMSGHPAAIRQGFALLRNGGRASLLGLPSKPFELDIANAIIFKGATVHGINGRKMYETWFQAESLMRNSQVDLSPVITHRLPLAQFDHAMKLLESGEASRDSAASSQMNRRTLRILHDERVGEPEVHNGFSRDNNIAISSGSREKCACACA